MPEPFKNIFNATLVENIAHHLARVAQADEFNPAGFTAAAIHGLDKLELKARSQQITLALMEFLPNDFTRTCELIIACLHPEEHAPLAEQVTDAHGLRGWAIMPLADVVATRGADSFDLAMHTLGECSKRFTAEFAVRPLIIHDLERALVHITAWALDANVHLRRLASEGARPRLPWGVQIPSLIQNPRPLLPVLQQLRDDPSDYVRKSVANHLNDIAKDHPGLVMQVAQEWLVDAPPTRQRLVRHACRSLIKKGDKKMLALLGYAAAAHEAIDFQLSAAKIQVGETLELSCTIRSSAEATQELLLDYVVHFCSARGRTGEKVFKWKAFTLAAKEQRTLTKKHSFKPITTRRYYPGIHKIQLQLNGIIVAEETFELRADGGGVGSRESGA